MLAFSRLQIVNPQSQNTTTAARPMRVVAEQGFANLGLVREGFSNVSKLNAIIRGAAHSRSEARIHAPAFRKTLTHYSNEICETPEAFKA